MAVGNAIGSVTANTGLIMAIAFIFLTIIAPRKSYVKQCILLLSAAAVLWLGSLQGRISSWAGVGLVTIFFTSTAFNVIEARQKPTKAEKVVFCKKDIFKNIALFLFGVGELVIGSNLLINSGSNIAVVLSVPERVVAITMVAIGTSLPELVTTITAIKKMQTHLSVGNIIGANIIDLSLILPICTFVSGGTFSVSQQCLQIDFPVCLVFSVIAIVPMILKEHAYKLQGAIMLLIYATYLFVAV